MKKISNLSLLFCLIFVLFFISCNPTINPELLPLLTTAEVTSITQTTAVSGGGITSDRGSSVIARGVCWSTKANPTIADSKTSDGAGIGSFTSNITGLTAGTVYYIVSERKHPFFLQKQLLTKMILSHLGLYHLNSGANLSIKRLELPIC